MNVPLVVFMLHMLDIGADTSVNAGERMKLHKSKTFDKQDFKKAHSNETR